MGLSKSCKIKLFQQATGWSTDKMKANKKVVSAICGDTDNVITYDKQNLTEEQQAQARQNIGAANDSEVVKYISQDLTEEQKAQARTNIGTISKEEAEALVANNAIVVAALPEPSAETMGKTYLLGPDQNDNYIRYITSYDGNTYTWIPYGSTEMDLTQYAKKDTDAIEDNLAKFDANGNPVDSGISKDDVALKNGSYDNMSVGTARNLEGRSIVTDSFFQRTTGGDAEISNGTAQLVEVKGKSQVWNQLVGENATSVTVISGHKYMSVIGGVKTIGTSSDSAINVTGGSDMVFDLTLIFGAGNEPSTVEEIEAWLAENIGTLPYYPYNAGQVINNNLQGIESIGQNLLDPVTGKAIILGEYSDVYGNYYGITGTHGTITFTDNLGNSETITPDAEGKFELLVPGTLTVATPGEDCSVFLWWDGTKTEYTPYEVNVGKLDVTHIYGKKNGTGELVQVWPTGMPGIGDIKDSLKVVDGQVVAERKVGEVDMLTMNFGKTTNDRFVAPFTGVHPVDNAHLANILCSKYLNVSKNTNVNSDKTICVGAGTDGTYVHDSSYSELSDFLNAISGIPFYYELATPEVYTDLVYQGSSLFSDGTPVTLPVNYKVDNWGIENILPKNTESQILTSKPTIICKYSIDAIEMLDTHDAEINQLGEQIEGLDERKPEKVGDYPGMSVGSAKTLAGQDTNVEDFVFKALDCADGIAKLNSVRGKSLVMNQLVQNGNFVSSDNWVFQNANGSISNNAAKFTATEKYGMLRSAILTLLPNHKYCIGLDIIFTSNEVHFQMRNSTQSTASIDNVAISGRNSAIFTYNGLGTDTNIIRILDYATSDWAEITVKNVILIDLTLMFGAGNEPTTVAEFEAMFPLLYYNYNKGEIISNKTNGIKVVGFNQWDGQITDNSKYLKADGTLAHSNDYCVSDYINILPNTEYYFKDVLRDIASSPCICWYDSDKNVISSISGGPYVNGKVLTFPQNAVYLRLSVYIPTIDICCINLSDPSHNGEYKHYNTNTIELNLPTLTGKLNGEGNSVVVFPDGLKSAGSVYDEIVGNKAIKRVGVVDLGTLAYTKFDTSDGVLFRTTEVGGSTNNLLCASYITVTQFARVEKSIYRNSNNAIDIIDSTYTDAATFKTAMDGVLLYYELATPEEYILDTPIPDTFQAYKGGTIKQLPENTNEPITAPCIIVAIFSIDAVGTIIGLPKNYISKESLQAMLNAMQSAGIISSYTMTFNENTNKYDFTFTAPNNP